MPDEDLSSGLSFGPLREIDKKRDHGKDGGRRHADFTNEALHVGAVRTHHQGGNLRHQKQHGAADQARSEAVGPALGRFDLVLAHATSGALSGPCRQSIGIAIENARPHAGTPLMWRLGLSNDGLMVHMVGCWLKRDEQFAFYVAILLDASLHRTLVTTLSHSPDRPQA